jgi:preprotein translocase subunit SecE
MERIKLYVLESYNELIHKVDWPSWASLQSSTVLVIVSSFILALLILLMDFVSNNVTGLIYGIN